MSYYGSYRETLPVGLGRPAKPVTLPPVKLADANHEEDTRATAEKFSEWRTIKTGAEAWQELGRAGSFSAWCAIGAALYIGKLHSLRTSGVRQAWGAAYSKAFNKWRREHNLFNGMRPSDLSHALDLHEHLKEILAWRATLPNNRLKRLCSAQHNVRSWRKEVGQPARRDDVTKALAAWRHFRNCMRVLSPSHAGEIWAAVAAEAMAHA